MFSRNNKRQTTDTSYEVSSKPAQHHSPKPGVIPSILAEDMRITGDLVSAGEVQIDGEVTGDVEARALIIGESAHVRGEIIADVVRVSGAVTGRIRAREVVLTRSARVEGDILHDVLAIEAGASLQGNCRRRQPVEAEEAKAGETKALTGPDGSSSEAAE